MLRKFRKHPIAATVLLFSLAAMGGMGVFSVVQGRAWIMDGIRTPGYDQQGCVALLFHSPELDSGVQFMESLISETSIQKKLGGHIESSAYTMPVFGLRSVKISAPAENMESVRHIVKEHLAARYPSLHPGFFASGEETDG